MYNYSQILRQAFKVAWQNPGLWFFGFFVALAGGAGDLDFLLGDYNFSGESLLMAFFKGLLEGGLLSLNTLKGLAGLLFSNPLLLFLAILVSLLVIGFSILLLWIVIVSQAALIFQAVNIVKNRPVSWRQGFSAGLVKFWPVLGINILFRLIIGALFVALGYLSFFMSPVGFTIFIIIFDIILVVAFLAAFVSKYALCGIVLKDWRFLQSIKLGLDVFRKNWLLTFEVAVLVFTIYLAVNVVLFIILPFVLFYFLRIFINFTFGFILFLIVGTFLFIAMAMMLAIFRWVSWVIVFELLTSKKSLLLSFIKRIYSR